ncbi:MAG: amidohydrolase family protein [Candidatus Zipacnadales bacterium]
MTETLLITARSVWTGNPGNETIAPGAVAVEGARIAAVGHPTQLMARYTAPYKVISLDGLHLLPGLINTHVHLTMNAGVDPVSDYRARDDFTLLLRAAANARTMLFSGVTTIRDCGSRGYALVALKQEEVQKQYPLPHVLVSGPPLTPTGGHLHWMGGTADGVDGVRVAVRTRVKEGVDTLKLVATGGQMTPRTRPEAPAYTLAELRSAVNEARRLGMVTAAHCLCASGIILAVRAGLDCIEHAAFFTRDQHGRLVRKFDREAAQALADAGTYVAPCLSAGYHRLDPVRGGINPGAKDRFWLEQEELMFEHFAELVRMGVPMVVGTDAGVTLTPFDETFLELALMVRAGLSPEKALLAATYYAARALGLGGRKGTIEPGADADLIGCPADPCADVEALATVVWVMREGKILVDWREKEVTPT